MNPAARLPDVAVFDSNILIDFLNFRLEARIVIESVQLRYVSVVSRTELLVGISDTRSHDAAHKLLSLCQMCDVTVAIADRAALLRRKYRFKLPDALVAATAAEFGVPLLTRDAALASLPRALTPYRLQ